MTKKDFELIAQALRDWRRQDMRIAHSHNADCLCVKFANLLQKKNPRFDRGRFLSACMPEEDLCESFTGQRGALWCSSCSRPRLEHSGEAHKQQVPPSAARNTPRRSRRK